MYKGEVNSIGMNKGKDKDKGKVKSKGKGKGMGKEQGQGNYRRAGSGLGYAKGGGTLGGFENWEGKGSELCLYGCHHNTMIRNATATMILWLE